MNNKKINIVLIVSFTLQIFIMSWLTSNEAYRAAGLGWMGIILSSWPLVPAALFSGFAASRYEGVPLWVSKSGLLGGIIIAFLLYVLSVFVYANAIFITR